MENIHDVFSILTADNMIKLSWLYCMQLKLANDIVDKKVNIHHYVNKKTFREISLKSFYK